MIPKLFSEEPALFEPTRLAIVCEVAKESDDEMTFVQLKRSLGLTDGNLNRHLHRLTTDGILTCTREKQSGRRPRTVVRITSDGRARLASFAEALAQAAHHGREVIAGVSNHRAESPRDRSAMQSEYPSPASLLRQPVELPNVVDDRFLGVD